MNEGALLLVPGDLHDAVYQCPPGVYGAGNTTRAVSALFHSHLMALASHSFIKLERRDSRKNRSKRKKTASDGPRITADARRTSWLDWPADAHGMVKTVRSPESNAELETQTAPREIADRHGLPGDIVSMHNRIGAGVWSDLVWLSCAWHRW